MSRICPLRLQGPIPGLSSPHHSASGFSSSQQPWFSPPCWSRPSLGYGSCGRSPWSQSARRRCRLVADPPSSGHASPAALLQAAHLIFQTGSGPRTWVAVESSPVDAHLAGVLDKQTGSNVVLMIKGLSQDGHRAFFGSGRGARAARCGRIRFTHSASGEESRGNPQWSTWSERRVSAWPSRN